ncbi:MAG: ribosome small subunit-dependent GTPase A [Clostridia bacterium]|nr:ribosome small subunit-dependent GTPase A [Clostridia bacterium]
MNQTNGKILKGVGGLYTVRLLDSEDLPVGTEVSCRARGSFRHEGISPLPGDTVVLGHSEEGDYVIDTIADRRNFLIRPPMANLDYLFVTMAAAAPTPILITQDKLLSISEHNGIEPIVVITKRELNPAYAEELESIYKTAGFVCFSLSAETGEGVAPLSEWIEAHLPEKIAAFAGASGIGKSTLLNSLFPQLKLSTSEISRKIERGRHTTRKVELFPLSDTSDCGYIADTPGFSMLDFERFDFFDCEDLPETMREFIPYIGACKYTKCSHTKEEGCAILAAVRRGEIPKSRHDSYVELHGILKNKKKWK